MKRSWITVMLLALFVGATVASAGQRPSAGGHTANPGGGFVVSGDQSNVTWTDGNNYAWVPSPPPAGNGYYRYPGPPPKTLTFLNGDYEWTSGFGTYSPL